MLPETEVELTFNTEIIRATYEYDFIVRPDWEVGLVIGVHWTRIEVGYDLLIKEFDGNGKRIKDNEEFKQDVPLPVLGFRGSFALSDDWRLNTSVEAFRVKLFGVKAGLIDFRLGLEWDALRNVGVELMYTFFTADIEYEASKFKAEARYSYQGIVLALRLYF